MSDNSAVVDNNRLKNICKRHINWFWRKYAEHIIEDAKGRKCIYIDNGSKVLAVAHMDTVINVRKKFNFNTYTRSNARIIKCPTLDDRLGVYIITDMLPALLGEKWADILLTDEEESGSSTSDIFVDKYKDEKEYNWIVEFDRHGGELAKTEHAVLYNYSINGKEFKAALNSAGFTKLGRGSFTDITTMQDMGVKAFNVAVGYVDNHSTKAFMYPAQTELAVTNFIGFYNTNKEVVFKHDKVTYAAYGTKYGTRYQPTTPYDDYPRYQSRMALSGPLIAKGLEVKGSAFKMGDVVYNRKYAHTSKTLYIVGQVFEYADDQFKYNISAIDGAYTTSLVDECYLTRSDDVCSYCFSRPSLTWMYYDELGMFFLCDTCRGYIFDGDAMCEECGDLFKPDEYTNGSTWGSECPSCMRAQALCSGDVIIFTLPSMKHALSGVPFLIIGRANNDAGYLLWDGSETYTNEGNGYKSSWMTPIEYGVAMESFVDKYGDRTWSAVEGART